MWYSSWLPTSFQLPTAQEPRPWGHFPPQLNLSVTILTSRWRGLLGDSKCSQPESEGEPGLLVDQNGSELTSLLLP